MSAIVRTTSCPYDDAVAAKHMLRDAREAHGLSRAQVARGLGHLDDRTVRAWEDEDASSHFPVAALLNPGLPDDMFEFVVEKVRKARGSAEPLGADTPQEALLALVRDVGQYTVWTGTVGLAGANAKTAPQGLQIVEKLLRSGTVAARFLRRAITGQHATAKGRAAP